MNKELVDKIAIKYALCFYVTGLRREIHSSQNTNQWLMAKNEGTIASFTAVCVFGCLFV